MKQLNKYGKKATNLASISKKKKNQASFIIYRQHKHTKMHDIIVILYLVISRYLRVCM